MLRSGFVIFVNRACNAGMGHYDLKSVRMCDVARLVAFYNGGDAANYLRVEADSAVGFSANITGCKNTHPLGVWNDAAWDRNGYCTIVKAGCRKKLGVGA